MRNRRRRINSLIAGAAAIAGLSCNEHIVRACDFTFADALLHIVSATDATTGMSQGRYEFVVSKAGYRDYPVAIDAHFGKVTGDCERVLCGGVAISVQLVQL
ncbi:MAG TPA: hypothetical protein VL308_21670 [Gemmatimonadaceae bacterium]|jgi:hypothetical protein|nr:hypothetical protein [Gemmatimonadaceae bacterium]